MHVVASTCIRSRIEKLKTPGGYDALLCIASTKRTFEASDLGLPSLFMMVTAAQSTSTSVAGADRHVLSSSIYTLPRLAFGVGLTNELFYFA